MDQEILSYYETNKKQLNECFETLKSKIDGRIPHDSIIILKILSDIRKIETYIEIGVHNGGSMGLMLLTKNIKKCYGIDLFEDVYDEKKHLNREKFNKYQYFRRDNLSKMKTLKSLKNINQEADIELIQGNTYFDKTEQMLVDRLGDEKVDLLFIDGDHTAEGVKNDYNRYSKYVKDDGFIIFDDYHHLEIKKYVDKMMKGKKPIIIFKSDNSDALDILIKKSYLL